MFNLIFQIKFTKSYFLIKIYYYKNEKIIIFIKLINIEILKLSYKYI